MVCVLLVGGYLKLRSQLQLTIFLFFFILPNEHKYCLVHEESGVRFIEGRKQLIFFWPLQQVWESNHWLLDWRIQTFQIFFTLRRFYHWFTHPQANPETRVLWVPSSSKLNDVSFSLSSFFLHFSSFWSLVIHHLFPFSNVCSLILCVVSYNPRFHGFLMLWLSM